MDKETDMTSVKSNEGIVQARSFPSKEIFVLALLEPLNPDFFNDEQLWMHTYITSRLNQRRYSEKVDVELTKEILTSFYEMPDDDNLQKIDLAIAAMNNRGAVHAI